ncbi:hypothetical protein FAF44_50690 [Nonomuraea sp. MG754425]|uniref:hypothetical protein n=1 Tax=Nonomuraea sp. MG754425 TaxID=2570319 RepID=UPI001F38C9FC|nr:hypothetical protein [Nonomuraea sp. MG754425]MCF6476546.1 hypothetical protein [Nonomuraea sp. MG754425]
MTEWADTGFTQGEVRRWRRARFAPGQAAAWRAAGVSVPADARLWSTAAATPHTVITWQRAGMTPQDAVRWHELGVAPHDAARRHLGGERPHRIPWPARLLVPEPTAAAPEIAHTLRSLLRAGVPADVARAYADAGWDADEAGEWARRRVDQGDARVFRALGFTAAEAARTGLPAVAVLATWWGSVPLEEVAAWCAAGLTPQEAGRQRAAGVTVEQAGVLRALSAFGEEG